MTLSQLNRIAAKQKVEPDLPGVHSSGIVATLPAAQQRALFQEMRAVVDSVNTLPEVADLQARVQAAQTLCLDLERQLLAANAEFDRLWQLLDKAVKTPHKTISGPNQAGVETNNETTL